MAAGSCGPREEPRNEPPILWIRPTTSGVRSTGSLAGLRHQSREAEAEPVDAANAVVVVKAQHDRADDVVQAGTEAAAGHDAAGQRRWIEEEPLPRACALHRRRIASTALQRFQFVEGRGVEDPLVIADEPNARHRRRHDAVAVPLDREVEMAGGLLRVDHDVASAVPAERSSTAARFTRLAIACSASAR